MFTQIEVNKNCNLRCWFCQNSQYDIPPNKVMSMEDFTLVLNNISKCWTRQHMYLVSFAAYNEPTLDPFFRERLLLLTQKGFVYWWISNGTNMTPDLVDWLIQNKPRITNMHFNIPSCEPDRLSRLVGLSEDKARKALNNFELFVQRLPEIGVSASIAVHGNADSDNLKDHEIMQKWMEPYGVQVSFAGAMDRAGMLKGVGKKFTQNSIDLRCKVNYPSNLYVGVDGSLYICCHDYYQTTKYGNILSDDLHNTLSGFNRFAAMQKVRRDFCIHCEFAEVQR